MTAPLKIHEDRAVIVPAGKKIITQYIPITCVEIACRDRMSIGDLQKAMDRVNAAAPDQCWPCPVGEWKENPAGERRFSIYDGRHEFIAKLMLGYSDILIAYLE